MEVILIEHCFCAAEAILFACSGIYAVISLFRPDFKSMSTGLVDLLAALGCWELAARDGSELASVAI